jgi:hypothetical protein
MIITAKNDTNDVNSAKDENYQTGAFEIAQLGGSDLAVDLRQALLTAHGEQRMPKSDKDGHDGNSRSRIAS